MDANPNAPVFIEREIYIEAPRAKVWALLSDIDRWTSWQPDIRNVRLMGPLAPGSKFKWTSRGTPVSSTLQEVDAPHRLGWTGRALGTRARHVCVLEPKGNGVIVKTKESFEGLIAVLLKGTPLFFSIYKCTLNVKLVNKEPSDSQGGS